MRFLVGLLVIGATICYAEDIGFCPTEPAPFARVPKPTVPAKAPSPDLQYAGTITLLAVLSDTGHVCSTRVLKSFDKQLDKKAGEVVRHWRFTPAMKSGHPVSVVVTVNVTYWKKSNGEIVSEPSASNLSAVS